MSMYLSSNSCAACLTFDFSGCTRLSRYAFSSKRGKVGTIALVGGTGVREGIARIQVFVRLAMWGEITVDWINKHGDETDLAIRFLWDSI